MKRQSVLKMIFNKDFVLSAVIPLAIYYGFDHMGQTLNGIIASGAWGVLVFLITLLKSRKVNYLAMITAVVSIVGLVGTVLSKNPRFYMAYPIFTDILFAGVFIGTAFCKRPFLRAMVEGTWGDAIPMAAREKASYIGTWKYLSVAWGLLNITQAVLRTMLFFFASMNTYYAISTVYSNTSSPLLLVFSFWFPRWYMTRKQKETLMKVAE